MYNEVERMVLDSIVECSYCGTSGKDVKCLGLTTTIAGRGPDAGFRFYNKWLPTNAVHDHDTNYISATYECVNGHKFHIVPLNACWCGWRQQSRLINGFKNH